ncbi:MAG: alpha/beta fold hydrolase [Caulobacterales bacterium]
MDAVVRHEPKALKVWIETPHGAGEMAYLDFGPAERPVDVVFLHANGFNARTYRTILAPLAGELRILAPDQRGHGSTTLPTQTDGRTDWREMTSDLLAFMEALKVPSVVLAGHSMGGTASLFAAAQAPQKVRALVLLDPVILPPDAARARAATQVLESPMVMGASKRRRAFASRAAVIEAYRGRGAFRTWTDEMLADYVADGFKDRPDGSVELACAPEWEVSNYVSQAHDSWGAFEASRCPIDVLRAEHESPMRIEGREAALTQGGRIRIQTVPGTTHFLPMERPDLVRAAIKAAVAGR